MANFWLALYLSLLSTFVSKFGVEIAIKKANIFYSKMQKNDSKPNNVSCGIAIAGIEMVLPSQQSSLSSIQKEFSLARNNFTITNFYMEDY